MIASRKSNDVLPYTYIVIEGNAIDSEMRYPFAVVRLFVDRLVWLLYIPYIYRYFASNVR